jgi:hypothetical protein
MATISVELVPFPVPTGASLRQAPGRRQDGFKPAEVIPLTQLSPIVLDTLCEEFRTAVFKAAGYNPLFNRVQNPDDVEGFNGR